MLQHSQAMPYSRQAPTQTAMVTVIAARPMFSTDTSVFCSHQSGAREQRISENAECKLLPIIGNDEIILKKSWKTFKTNLVSLKN
jgi:hypothetical protein